MAANLHYRIYVVQNLKGLKGKQLEHELSERKIPRSTFYRWKKRHIKHKSTVEQEIDIVEIIKTLKCKNSRIGVRTITEILNEKNGYHLSRHKLKSLIRLHNIKPGKAGRPTKHS